MGAVQHAVHLGFWRQIHCGYRLQGLTRFLPLGFEGFSYTLSMTFETLLMILGAFTLEFLVIVAGNAVICGLLWLVKAIIRFPMKVIRKIKRPGY